MSDAINKKLAEILGKMDEKVLQAKLTTALEMLKKGNTEELAKKMNKMNKDELANRINELDEAKLQELNINTDEIKEKLKNTDFDKLSQLIGEHGDEIVKKLKDIIK
jgi:hypothetical protein